MGDDVQPSRPPPTGRLPPVGWQSSPSTRGSDRASVRRRAREVVEDFGPQPVSLSELEWPVAIGVLASHWGCSQMPCTKSTGARRAVAWTGPRELARSTAFSDRADAKVSRGRSRSRVVVVLKWAGPRRDRRVRGADLKIQILGSIQFDARHTRPICGKRKLNVDVRPVANALGREVHRPVRGRSGARFTTLDVVQADRSAPRHARTR
jgi:hypothetical protein